MHWRKKLNCICSCFSFYLSEQCNVPGTQTPALCKGLSYWAWHPSSITLPSMYLQGFEQSNLGGCIPSCCPSSCHSTLVKADFQHAIQVNVSEQFRRPNDGVSGDGRRAKWPVSPGGSLPARLHPSLTDTHFSTQISLESRLSVIPKPAVVL